MKYGQQIKWLDHNNKWHVGTVVVNGGVDNGKQVWGVSHVLNPDQTTKQECFVMQEKSGHWKVFNKTGVGVGTMVYANNEMRNRGKYAPQAIPTASSMGVGDLVYRQQYQKQMGK
jgi:hypothetical protein